MVAAKTCKNGLYESIVYCDHCSCTFQCFKHNKICKHSLCVAEVSGILSQHLEYLRKTKCRSNPSRSELVEPTKQAQGKKGDCHKNPWRPPRGQLVNENKVRSEHPCHPYSEISCINERFPYYISSLIQIPIDIKGRLRESHQNLLAEELFDR